MLEPTITWAGDSTMPSDPPVVCAPSTGGSLGSVLSPAKVIVGCSTTGQSGQEGFVLRRLLPVGLVPLVLAGVLALLLS